MEGISYREKWEECMYVWYVNFITTTNWYV